MSINSFLRLAIYGVIGVFFSWPSSNANAAVTLELIGTRWDAYGNFLSEFQLTNSSEKIISYSGYSSSSPIYYTQLKEPNSWRDHKAGYCGVGLGTQHLAVGQSINFTVAPLDTRQAWRIAIEYNSVSTGGASQSTTEIALSTPIISQSKEQIDKAAVDSTGLARIDVASQPEREFPCVFTITNISTKSLFYGGYSEADVPPIYLNQERHLNVWKDDGSADWSGTGFGFKELLPGKSITFAIPAQSLDRSWRIGIRFFRSADPRTPSDIYRPIWSQQLPPRKKGT